MSDTAGKQSWLNRTVLGVGLTSLFSDWSHETATSVLPAFLAAIGAGPAWLGAIEGIADGLSSFAKLAAGYYTFTALCTASFGLATHAYQVLLGRAGAWLGRGVRSPARKALLAADVPPHAYGRAFGLERLMDTLGAIVGPVTALWLLEATGHSYHKVFFWTLLPGLVAVASFWLLVRERPVTARSHRSLFLGLKALPIPFRRLLLGVGIFGAGDFSHSLLILYASRMLAPSHGLRRAASLAVGLYTLHNIFSAGSAYLSGWLSDHIPQRKFVPGMHSLWLLALIFVLAGLYIGTEEPLEDSLSAELVPHEQHGMAFGTLAAVNAVGDFVSSLVVGFLWSAFNVQIAFAASAILFGTGAIFILRLR